MSLPAFETRHLRAFVALVEHHTVTGAARALGVAQSTLSEAIAALERAAGTSLVVRGRGAHRAIVTSAGQALLPHARAVLAALDSAQHALAEARHDARATVKVIANESVATYVLPRLLITIRARWPHTRFAVSVATCPDVRRGVHDGEFDVGLLLEARTGSKERRTPRRPHVPTFAAERLPIASDIPLVIFALPSHPLFDSSGYAARDALAPFPLLVSDAAGDFHDLVERLFRSKRAGAPVQPAGSVEGVKRGVLADSRSLGLLPAYAVADELRAGRLKRVDVRPTLPRTQLDALLSVSRPRHPSAIELIAELRRGIRKDHG